MLLVFLGEGSTQLDCEWAYGSVAGVVVQHIDRTEEQDDNTRAGSRARAPVSRADARSILHASHRGHRRSYTLRGDRWRCQTNPSSLPWGLPLLLILVPEEVLKKTSQLQASHFLAQSPPLAPQTQADRQRCHCLHQKMSLHTRHQPGLLLDSEESVLQ